MKLQFRVVLISLLLWVKVVYAQPVITSFSPMSGEVGVVVTITGTSFSSVAANNIVYFGAVRAIVTSSSSISLAVTVPAGASYSPVSVTTNGLTAFSTKPFNLILAGGGVDFSSETLDAKIDKITGNKPFSECVADLDGDGKPDIVVVNSNTNTFSVFRNISSPGSIVFDNKVDYTTGLYPGDITCADINGDGKLDILTINSNPKTVSVFINTSISGSVTFAASSDISLLNAPNRIKTADVDLDGKPDVIVTIPPMTISVLRNTSAGSTVSFAAPFDFTTVDYSYGITTADLDEDGKPDIIAGNTTSICYFKNNSTPGNIALGAEVNFLSGGMVDRLCTGDFDGDGKTDLATVSESYNYVSVLRNTTVAGNVAFAAAVDYATEALPDNIEASDMDGDGKPDIAVSNRAGNLSLFRNKSVSSGLLFAARVSYVCGTNPKDVALNDLDGDGLPDAAVVNYYSNTVSLLRNKLTAPVIDSLTPVTGTTGTIVTLKGKYFAGATAVSFGANPAASFIVVSSTVITATVGTVASGLLPVSVTTPLGSDTLIGFFTEAKVEISSFSPATAPAGTIVVIKGKNFSTTAANNVVYFGAAKATIVAATDTTLAVTAPAGTSYENISVAVNNRIAFSSKPFILTFRGGGGSFVPKSFNPKLTFGTDAYPMLPCMGDFDGDGKPDVAVVNQNGNTFSMLRNTSVGGTVSFAAKADYFTGSRPAAILKQDFNCDGKPDIVVANSYSNTVSIFINTSVSGAISFAPKVDISVQLNATVMTSGDLDNDGKPDLILATDALTIFRNTTSGGILSFAPAIRLSFSDYSPGLFMADMDNDGKPDIVGNKADTLIVMKNVSAPGAISFSRMAFATGKYIWNLCGGDFNGDGKTDVAAVNATDSIVRVLSNTSTAGSISFSSALTYKAGFNTLTVAAGDINGDGKPDLAVSNTDDGTLSLYENVSAGGVISFKPQFSLSSSNYVWGVAVNDLDGDGLPDLTSANFNANTISVFKSRMNAPFITSFSPAEGTTGVTVTITGWNFDGATSVSFGSNQAASFTIVDSTTITAVVGTVATGTVTVSVTTSRGSDTLDGFFTGKRVIINSFAPASGSVGTIVTVEGKNFNPVVANNIVFFGAVKAMVSSATDTTLAVVVPTGATYQPFTVTAYNYTAYSSKPFITTFAGGSTAFDTSSFTRLPDLPGGILPRSIAIGDLDGDGKPDIAMTNGISNTVSLYKNISTTGTILFAPKADYATGDDPTSIYLADIDNDGKLDIALTNGESNSFSIYRNNSQPGTLSLELPNTYPAGENPTGICVRDLNADGKPDIVVANHYTNISLFKNSSTAGSIVISPKVDFAAGSGQEVVIEDFNGDGKPDIAVSNGGNNISVPAAFTIYRNHATNAVDFTAASFDTIQVIIGMSQETWSIASGDLDEDEKPDIVVSNNASHTFGNYKNTSSGGNISFAFIGNKATGTAPESIEIGDLNGDGKPDVAVGNYGARSVSVYKNLAPSGVAVQVAYGTNDQLSGIAIGDLDGDERPDIVASGYSSFSVAILQNKIGTVLPLKFLTFSGKKTGNNAALKWITAGESDATRFIIERSTDGEKFDSIGSVNTARTSYTNHTYYYTDALNYSPVYYYRLKVMNVDGRFFHSTVVTVQSAPKGLTIYPNPATKFIQLNLNGITAETIDVSIADVSGKQLINKPLGLMVLQPHFQQKP